MNFCKHCNNLLPTPNTDSITCRCCGASSTWADAPEGCLDRITSSGRRPEPAWLLRRKKIGEGAGGGKDRATVDEPCPSCQHPQATFYTMQLRSVDEGSTVFYECLKCHHKWNQDN